MRSLNLWLATTSLIVAGLLSGPAWGETQKIRIPEQPGFTYLAFVVMEHDRLVEKHAAALGLAPIAVEYITLATNTGSIDALLSGAVDFVSVGVPAFLTMWAKSKGSLEIRGVGAYTSIPLILLTRNPNIHTIRDFTDASRIALPGVQASSQAIVLQMAAEAAFGPGNHTRLDGLTVTRGHPDAIAALLDRNSEIDSHFSAPPYANKELAMPGIHQVLTSTEIYGGPGTIGVTSTTRRFHDANPKAYRAVLEGLREAIAEINRDRPRVAQIYKAATGDPDSVESIAAILAGPDMVYDLTPRNVMQVAAFMQRTGSLKLMPADWQALFFPEIHDLPGS